MPVTVRSLTIRAPAARVWARLADVPRQPDWMHDLRTVELLDDGPLGVGTRAVGTVRMFGLSQVDPVEIDAFEPPRHLGLRHLGAFKGRGDLWVEPLPGGATRVVWREELRADAAALGLPARLAPVFEALDPLLGPVFELTFRSDLRRLRDQLVER